MKVETEQRKRLKGILKKLLDNKPEAHLVENRYKTLRAVLTEEYPGTIGALPKDKAEEILKAVVYLDRRLRIETEGEQEDEKEILSQEFQVEELGYEPEIKLPNT